MPQLEHIETIEKRPWTAANTLRANSIYTGNEHFLSHPQLDNLLRIGQLKADPPS